MLLFSYHRRRRHGRHGRRCRQSMTHFYFYFRFSPHEEDNGTPQQICTLTNFAIRGAAIAQWIRLRLQS